MKKNRQLETCIYIAWNDNTNVYECNQCGLAWGITEGDPFDNEMTYCPKCGRKIDMVKNDF